ncbi:hypothetical protein GCM10027592_41070 [Spirosoma flavus]
MTNKTVTAAEAGYSETLTFTGSYEGGTFQQVRNGVAKPSTSFSLSGGSDAQGTIFYSIDSTEQPFRRVDKTLYLSERVPKGATIADGATYQYQRQ